MNFASWRLTIKGRKSAYRMINIIIIDDHILIRQGLKAILRADTDFNIVAEAESGQELYTLLKTNITVDILILDIAMPGLNGIEVCKSVHLSYPQIKILALSLYEDIENLNQMLKAGAMGYLSKKASGATLISALKIIAGGTKFISPELSLKILHSEINQRSSIEKANAQSNDLSSDNILSRREKEVLKLIMQGLTNQQIADKLFISKRTLETHRLNLIKKTGSKNTAQLIKNAINLNLIEV